jgi:hypothetical protein
MKAPTDFIKGYIMKPINLLILIVTAGLTSRLWGYPLAVPAETGSLFGNAADGATRLIADSSDPQIFYIPPKRVVPVIDPFSGKRLFKLSYSGTQKTGEIFGVFSLSFDPDRLEAEWAALKERQPQAKLRQLPIQEGEFGIEMHQPGFALLIGRGETVGTDIGANFPVLIELNANGIDVLRAGATSGARTALVLNFEYTATYEVQGKAYDFSLDPQKFGRLLQEDPLNKEAWTKSETLTPFLIKRFLTRSFSENAWSSSDAESPDFNLNLAMILFYEGLGMRLKQQFGVDFDLAHRSSMSFDFTRLGDKVDFAGTERNKLQNIKDTAAMVIEGLCERYEDAVYDNVTGESKCLEIIGASVPPPPEGGGTGGDDGVWVPDF